MVMVQIYYGIVLVVSGLLVMIFSKFISKYIPTRNINLFSPSKKSGRRIVLWRETTNEFYGEQKGRKLVFWIFGFLPIITGFVLIILGIFGINVSN